jgi:hypothetical protein
MGLSALPLAQHDPGRPEELSAKKILEFAGVTLEERVIWLTWEGTLSGLGRIQVEPVVEISRVLADPGGNVPVWRAPDRVIFHQNTHLFERTAHDLESVFLFLQERVEDQGQVPAVSNDASQSRA